MESSQGPTGSFDDYMSRLSRQSQQLSEQIETIIKKQQQNPSSDDGESYTTATPSPIPQQTHRHHQRRISSPESEGQDEANWRLAHRRRYHRSHSVPSMRVPRYYSPEDDSGSSVSEISPTGSGSTSDDEESGNESQNEEEYNQHQQQLVHRRGSWDPMQPAPFDARIQHYERHPHLRAQSGPRSAGPMLQRHPTVSFTQPGPPPPPPPHPGMMFVDPMQAEMEMAMVTGHASILFGPPPPPPSMGVPPEFMGMANGDSGVMSTSMLAEAMLEGPPPPPPGHDMIQFQAPAPALELYQSNESKQSSQPLPRHQHMVAAIKQKLGRVYEKRSIRYSMISQRMYEQGQDAVVAVDAGANGLSRQSSSGRRRSVRRNASQNLGNAGVDKPDAMLWCFRPQRRLGSPAWEPFDRVHQMKLMEAASQNKPCVLQDSHFPQMINVVPSDGYGISRKMYGHVVYNVALLDPSKQSRTFLYCIPIGRRASSHIDNTWWKHLYRIEISSKR